MKSSKLRILLYHPVILPVLGYGGTERVAMWLVQTLYRLGHEVSVFAAPGSRMPEGIKLLTSEEALLKQASQFDVIHGFTRLSKTIEDSVNGRVLMTIHGNGKEGERFHPNTVFLSQNHAKRHGAECFVYNGLDSDELIYSDQVRKNRFLFFSKTSLRVKNLKGAMQLAKKHQKNLWIAGGGRPYSLRLSCSLNRWMGRDWRWLGTLDQKAKASFLIEGRALLFPILWNEPFGLVVMESLLSGTPVLANPYGALPELLSFAPQCLMKSESEWGSALRGEVHLPSARECRDWAVSMFDQKIMAQKYLHLYERVIQGEPLHDHEPSTQITAEMI